MADTLTLREFIALVNGTQGNIRLEVAFLFPVLGSRGGTVIQCGGAEVALGFGVGWKTLLDPIEQASILRDLGHEDLLFLFRLENLD
jgi:hypothetical protein